MLIKSLAVLVVSSVAVAQEAPKPGASPAAPGAPAAAAPSPTAPTAATPPTQPPPGNEGWWNDTVWYEIFVRSFADSNGDGIGDFKGLIAKLDYLNDGNPSTTTDLGVTGIWLMPIHPSPSYHGYDVTDYRGINPQYGTMDDFKAFMAECGKRGIKVVIDLVPNHCSDSHPFFVEASNPTSPRRDWFIWSPTDPGWKGPWGGPAWYKLGEQYYYGLFSKRMPDFNYNNPEVTKEMFSVVDFWLKDVKIDGFRIDAIRHLIEVGQQQENTLRTHAWLKDFYVHYKTARRDAWTVGEVWDKTENCLPYVGEEMDSVFEFTLATAILDSVNGGDSKKLTEAATKAWSSYPRNQFSTFLTNHDQKRAITYLKNDERKARLAAGLLLTLPGIPFLYYGEELGIGGDKPDENLRLPMPWNTEKNLGFTEGKPWRNLPPDGRSRAVAVQDKNPGSLLNHYRKLVHLRSGSTALRRGDFTHVPASSPAVFAFLRAAEGERYLVVANLSGNAVTKYALTLPTGVAGGEGLTDALGNAGAAGISADLTKPVATLAANGLYVIKLPR